MYGVIPAIVLAIAGPAQADWVKFNNSDLFPDVTYPGFESDNPVTVAGSTSSQVSPPKYPSPWGEGHGEWAGAYEKAREFVRQLTLEEKVNLTTGTGWEMDRCVGQTGSIPRLAFNSMCLQDSPNGVRLTDFVSLFPSGVNLAATWSRQLVHSVAHAMGEEHRGKGVDMQLGPVVGPMGRAPEAGRSWEGYSPDPYLTGTLASEAIQGMHRAGVMSSLKHAISYEQGHFRLPYESVTQGWNITQPFSSNLDDVTMHELYLWPFAEGIRAGAASVMCSYNQVNNSNACQNSYVLNHLIKNELGFQGLVISDWWATWSGVSSILAGLDMTMPGGPEMQDQTTGRSFWGANLTVAVLNGSVPTWRLDDAATRVMAAWYLVGRENATESLSFSSWTKDTYGPAHMPVGGDPILLNEHKDVRGNHASLVREVGAKSTVLLKNVNKTLPLTGKEKLTATFGEDAGPNILGPNSCESRACDNGTLAVGWGSGAPDFSYLITPDTAIQDEVLKFGGAYESILTNHATQQTDVLARRADVSIVFVNSDSGEGVMVENNYGDRNNLTLWKDGDELIKRVASSCRNTIVVVHSTGPVILEEIKENPNVTALLWAGLPGDQTGNSIADVLYGRVTPGAKLPFTIGAARSDWGTDVLYAPNNGTGAPQLNFQEGIFIDYRGFDRHNITPTYEFGYGLSYTSFSYSDLHVTKHSVRDYAATEGYTSTAPVLSNFSAFSDPANHIFPSSFTKTPLYIYPWLNSTNLASASGDRDYGSDEFIPAGAHENSPQPLAAAGGAPGGNPALWDIVYTVETTVTNDGDVEGDEVPQLYISLGGPHDAPLLLRGFGRLSIQPGHSSTFRTDIRRKDIMNWDRVLQNWHVSRYPKIVYVGSSSRSLPLSAKLE